MSGVEDAVSTIIRLLNSRMRVVLDSGGLAQVRVSEEWLGEEALNGVDGQVTA